VAPLDVTASLRPERAELLALLRDLSTEEWGRPTECPAWTVKGIALHVLGDDLSLLTRQRDASTDSLTLFAEDHPGYTFRQLLDGFNDQWVATARFLSTELLLTLLDLVGEQSAVFYETVGLDTVAVEPVQFFATLDPSPYWQVIAREYVERFVHQSQIRRALGRPELAGDLVTVAARVHAHMFAAWMRDLAPDAGASVGFVVGVVGDWTITRGIDEWTVAEGGASGADAVVTVTPEAAGGFVGRGLSADALGPAVTFAGDEQLARAAYDPVAPLFARPPEG
jgi:uncharacterized protein (TIGR03083 family)